MASRPIGGKKLNIGVRHGLLDVKHTRDEQLRDRGRGGAICHKGGR
jgi:hypothetical protein